MENFSLLVKPASADCNLRCEYCFYIDHSSLYPESKVHRMSDQVLDRMISSYLATDQRQYAFGWQGGEPTLMGLDFFTRVTELQVKYGRSGAEVSNGLQTNGTLLHDKFVRHLVRFNFLIGVSLDGPAYIHDHYRKKRGGAPSHADVLRGIRLLEANQAAFNILVLVNKANVNRPGEVYRYLVDNGWLYHQYIPCVEFDAEGRLQPFAVSGEEWGDFSCGLFDQWVKDGVDSVSIRLFDSILTYLADGYYNACHMDRNCCQYFVVEYNGDVYPCDFFVEEERKLGNVLNGGWSDFSGNQRYLDFGALKARWNQACRDCDFLDFCSGDCLKHRLFHGRGSAELSWLCAGWKKFFEHSLPTFRQIAREIKIERERSSTSRPLPPSAYKNVGRNDPCPCGSGKKYKKCCLGKTG